MFKKGDVVRCINDARPAKGILQLGEDYVVEEDEVAGRENILIVGKYRMGGASPRWGSGHFKLVTTAKDVVAGPEVNAIIPIPLTKDNVQVGLKVVCIEKGGNPALEGALDKVCEISEVTENRSYVRLKEFPKGTYAIEKFVLAPAVAAPKAVGDKIVCIEGYRPAGLVRGAEYTIKALYENKPLVRLEELPGMAFKQSRFEGLQGVVAIPKGVVAPIVAKPPVEPPKPLPEDIRDVLRAAKKKLGNMSHHITSFAYTPVGGKIKTAINPACFAALRNAGAIESFAVDTQCHVHLNNGTDKAFLNYLFNDSPWASGFLTKDAQEALDKGVLMNCERPISEVVGAATALREGIEQLDRLPLFNEMLEAGYHGNVAYLVAASCRRVGQSFVADAPQNSNHVALHTNLDKDALISFFLNGWPDLGKKPANKAGNHYDIWDDMTAGAAKQNGRYGEDKIEKSFANWFAATAKQTTTGTGWDKTSSIKTKGLYEFASLLETLIVKEKK